MGQGLIFVCGDLIWFWEWTQVLDQGCVSPPAVTPTSGPIGTGWLFISTNWSTSPGSSATQTLFPLLHSSSQKLRAIFRDILVLQWRITRICWGSLSRAKVFDFSGETTNPSQTSSTFSPQGRIGISRFKLERSLKEFLFIG